MAYAEALGKGDVQNPIFIFQRRSPMTSAWEQPVFRIKKGADEIGKMIGEMTESLKRTFALTPNGNLMANANFVAIPLRFSGTIDDRKIDMSGIDLFQVEAGRLQRYGCSPMNKKPKILLGEVASSIVRV